MIYGSIRVHMGPHGPTWVARGEKSNVGNVKRIISDSDFFLGLCHGDPASGKGLREAFAE